MHYPLYKTNYLKLLIYLLCFCSSHSTYSQQPNFVFKQLGEEEEFNGLGTNAFIYEDDIGFTWISSMSGLYRFDGQRTKYYSISPDGKYSENIQSTLFEDSSKNLWFTTVDGLHRYNRRTDDFSHKQLVLGNDTLRESYNAFYLHQSSGLLWMQANKKMFAYDTVNDTIVSDTFPTKGIRYSVDTSEHGDINRIFAYRWLLGGELEVWSVDTLGHWSSTLHLDDLIVSRGILENDSIIWLVTDIGFLEYDYKHREIIDVYKPKNDGTISFQSIIRYNEQVLLLSTNNHGLWAFDTKQRRFSKNWLLNDKENSISSNAPSEIYLGKSGRLWIDYLESGLDYGLSLKSSKVPPLALWGDKKMVKNILEDAKGRVWVLIRGMGIMVFDQSQQLLFEVKKIGKETNFSKAYLSKDAQGNIYISLSHSIFKYDLLTESWNHLVDSPSEIYSIIHDINDRSLALTINGVYELSQNKDSLFFKRLPLLEKDTSFDFKHFFKIDEQRLFAPFRDREFRIIDISGKDFQLLDNVELGAEIYDAIKSKASNKVWLGSRLGLHLYTEKKTPELILNQQDFGENTTIYKIIEQPIGILWLSTNKGMWRYRTADQQLLRYTQDSSLPSSSLFSKGAGVLAKSGKIWLNGKGRLQVFDPSEFKVPEHPPSLYIESIRINDNRYHSWIDLDASEPLRLKYFENRIGIQFRLIDYEGGGKIRYRLKDETEHWTWSENEALVELVNLPAGEYQLEVMALSAYHIEGEIKSLTIYIPLPFWKTWWFKIGVILCFIALFFLILRAYFQKKIRVQQRLLAKQKMINAERSRIARELHDDMGGRLSSILFLSEDMQLEQSADLQSAPIGRISSLTRQALANMKDIVWALDDSSNSLKDFAGRIRIYASELLTDHHIELKTAFQFDDEERQISSSERKRNMLFLVKECLHNIIKHAEASKVLIEMNSNAKRLEIKIEDNGKGFMPNEALVKGNGLKNIRQRSMAIGGALNINSTPQSGTSISLHIPAKVEPKL